MCRNQNLRSAAVWNCHWTRCQRQTRLRIKNVFKVEISAIENIFGDEVPWPRRNLSTFCEMLKTNSQIELRHSVSEWFFELRIFEHTCRNFQISSLFNKFLITQWPENVFEGNCDELMPQKKNPKKLLNISPKATFRAKSLQNQLLVIG